MRESQFSFLIKNNIKRFVKKFNTSLTLLTPSSNNVKMGIRQMFETCKTWRYFGLRIGLSMALVAAFAGGLPAQEVVDRTVATVSDGVRTELITYSDILWQIALQPNASLDPPRPDDLNAALLRLVDQRLFALEAERLPRPAPTEKEISAEIAKTLKYFPSTAVFEERLKRVGFDSIKDENFERIIAMRVSIDNYIDFRFRSFIVITPDEEAKYYREQFAPNFRKKYPGLLMPTLDEKRKEINGILTEDRVAERIESFLDDAKRRDEVELLVSF